MLSTVRHAHSSTPGRAVKRTAVLVDSGLGFWTRPLQQWLPSEVSTLKMGTGFQRVMRHIAQALGCAPQEISGFFSAEFFADRPDLDSGAFSAPAIDYFTQRLDRVTLIPFRQALSTARRQSWSPQGERLLGAEQAVRLRVAVALRHLIWSQVARVLLLLQKRNGTLNSSARYLVFIERSMILQNALLDGVQATGDLLNLLYTDGIRTLGQAEAGSGSFVAAAVRQSAHPVSGGNPSAGPVSLSPAGLRMIEQPRTLLRLAEAASDLQDHFHARSSEAYRLDSPPIRRQDAAGNTRWPYAGMVARLAAALASAWQPGSAAMMAAAPAAIVVPAVAPRGAHLAGAHTLDATATVTPTGWQAKLFDLLTSAEKQRLGAGADYLLGVALNRSSVPLGLPSLFIELDAASTQGNPRAYFFCVPVQANRPDWKALLSETDLDDLGASLNEIQVTLPGQPAPPSGVTLMRKTALWQGNALTVTFYVLSH